MTGRLAAWRAALRIARRDAARSKGRTALIAAMIGLPVLLVSGVDVVARSSVDGPEQVVRHQLGTHPDVQAVVNPGSFAGPLRQSPDASLSRPVSDDPVRESARLSTDEIRARVASVIPAGDRVVISQPHSRARFRVVAGDGSRSVTADIRQADWSEPGLAGMVDVVEGRLPTVVGEVALTASFARHVGLRVGDSLGVDSGPGQVGTAGVRVPLTVVGIAREHLDRLGRTVLFPAGPFPLAGIEPNNDPRAYIVGPVPVTWADVLRLNELGFTVRSRSVLLNPPPAAEVPPVDPQGEGSAAVEDGVIIVTAVGLTLLEVTLLAGPAFAVGARRNLRLLALIAASGGDRRHVRDIVLAGGVVIGFGASVAVAVLGAGLGSAAIPVLEHFELADFAHTDIRVLDLLGVVAVGTLTAVAAAVLPARQASRLDVVAALAGRRGQPEPARRVPVLGVVAIAGGAGLGALGAVSLEPLLVIAGTAVATLGLVATAGSLVNLTARLAHRLTVAPRIALRDAARQRGRTAPAVGAVMAAVTGSVAISLYVAALDEHDRRNSEPVAVPGGVVVSLSPFPMSNGTRGGTQALPRPVDPARIEPLVRADLPVEDLARLSVPATAEGMPYYARPDIPAQNRCPLDGSDLAAYKSDPRCGSDRTAVHLPSEVVVDDGHAVELIAAGPRSALRATLAAGHVAVTNPLWLRPDGTVRLILDLPSDFSNSGLDDAPLPREVVLPARFVDDSAQVGLDAVVIPPEAARSAGLAAVPGHLVATTTRLPTEAEEERAGAAISDAGFDLSLQVKRGYVSNYRIGLLALAVAAGVITLGATGIAVGLAAADGRPDLATLAAIGASPGLRRRLAASQAAMIAVPGMLMGLVAGGIPGLALVWMEIRREGLGPTWQFVVPWPNLLAIAVVVPALAAGCGWLFTRSRLPMGRRSAA